MGCNSICSIPTIESKKIIQNEKQEEKDNVEHIYVKSRLDTEFNGVILKDANIGHYLIEKLLNEHSEVQQSSSYKNKLQKWQLMCKTGLSDEISKEMMITNMISRPYSSKLYLENLILESDAEIGLANFLVRNTSIFQRRVKKGPPSKYRWVAWKTSLNFLSIFQKGKYDELLKQTPDEEVEANIKKDIQRTFPEHKLFKNGEKYCEKGFKSLFNILNAYSIKNPTVSYFQGMNFLAGFILLISGFREEESFWVFVSLMENYFISDKLRIKGIECLFKNYFPLLKILNHLISIQMISSHPKIKIYLENELNFNELLWYHKWILTMFLSNFSFTSCILIWDNIVAKGFSFIISFILTIVKYLEKEILTLDFVELSSLFNHINERVNEHNIEMLLLKASKMQINWELMEKEKSLIEMQIYMEIEQVTKINEDSKKKLKNIEKEQQGTIEDHKKERKEENKQTILQLKNKTDEYLRKSNALFEINSRQKLYSKHSSFKHLNNPQCSNTHLPPIPQNRPSFVLEQELIHDTSNLFRMSSRNSISNFSLSNSNFADLQSISSNNLIMESDKRSEKNSEMVLKELKQIMRKENDPEEISEKISEQINDSRSHFSSFSKEKPDIVQNRPFVLIHPIIDPFITPRNKVQNSQNLNEILVGEKNFQI